MTHRLTCDYAVFFRHIQRIRRQKPQLFELPGRRLLEPMVFHDMEPRPAVHLDGFLSQKLGSELCIFNAAGEVIQPRRYEPVLPLSGAVGGLHGP